MLYYSSGSIISLDVQLFDEKAEIIQRITRDYWSIWKQFVLHGVMLEDVLPPALMQSWRHCAALGLDPYSEPHCPLFLLNHCQHFAELLYFLV